MKTATLVVSVNQDKSMFNPSSQMNVHYRLNFKYKSEQSLTKRLNKSTQLINSQLSNIGLLVGFSLIK